MARWMGEEEMQVTVETGWQEHGPILVRGFHHVPFENRGTVLVFEENRRLVYTHLSSVSGLPDNPENHAVFSFWLTPEKEGTILSLALRNFPTASIRKHLELYWPPTLALLGRLAEGERRREKSEK